MRRARTRRIKMPDAKVEMIIAATNALKTHTKRLLGRLAAASPITITTAM